MVKKHWYHGFMFSITGTTFHCVKITARKTSYFLSKKRLLFHGESLDTCIMITSMPKFWKRTKIPEFLHHPYICRHQIKSWSVRVAEGLVLTTLVKEVIGLNFMSSSAEGRIQFMTTLLHCTQPFIIISKSGFTGGFGFSQTPFWLNISFSYKVLDKYDKFGIPYLPYSHPLLFTLYFSSTSQFYYLWMCLKLLMRGKQHRPWCSSLWHLIWVCTVCWELSFQIHRVW